MTASSRQVTYAEASAALDVPEGTIRAWKARELVTPRGIADLHQRGSRDVPVFVLAELQPLADAYHRRRAERAARRDAGLGPGDVVT